MSIHKFDIDQQVRWAKQPLGAAQGIYKISRCLPPDERGEPQYRMKSLSETFERTARESDLVRSRGLI
jgi:hypothetical protein